MSAFTLVISLHLLGYPPIYYVVKGSELFQSIQALFATLLIQLKETKFAAGNQQAHHAGFSYDQTWDVIDTCITTFATFFGPFK